VHCALLVAAAAAAGCDERVGITIGHLNRLCASLNCSREPPDLPPLPTVPACDLAAAGELAVPTGAATVLLPAVPADARSGFAEICQEGALLSGHADAALSFTLEERLAVELAITLDVDEEVEVALAPVGACDEGGTAARCDVTRGGRMQHIDPWLEPGEYVVFVRSLTFPRERSVVLSLRAVPPADNATCETARPLPLPATLIVDPLAGGAHPRCPGNGNPGQPHGPVYVDVELPPQHALLSQTDARLLTVASAGCEMDVCDWSSSGIVAWNEGDTPTPLMVGLMPDAPTEVMLEAVPIPTNTTCLSATPLTVESGLARALGAFSLNATSASCEDADFLQAAFFYAVEIPPGGEALAEGNEGTLVFAFEGTCQSNCAVGEEPRTASVANPEAAPMIGVFGISTVGASTFGLSITVDDPAPK
jgi:hypothetical protein